MTPAPTTANEAMHSHPSEPGPATGGRFYNEDKQPPSVMFKLCPDPTRLWHCKYQDWVAFLEVKCFDVPRLMREGFRWDASNVIREEGYIEGGQQGPTREPVTSAFKRWYFLTDLQQPRRWIASLNIRALDVNTLYNFDLSHLSRERIRSATAENHYQRLIYQYQSYTFPDKSCGAVESPMTGFNTIYDKMPMEGFWPWPRRENDNDTKGRSVSVPRIV
ncbi:hypothetical protein F5B17DRAFT_444896 [Nemania serpens]|nr:hypothetical protein F5B17DRAFT_444896 [Nemania serpens]